MHQGFANYLAERGRADRTITEYVRVINRTDRWIRERHGVPIEAARPIHIAEYCRTLPESWSTRKQVRTALSHWQTWIGHPSDLAGAVRVPRKPKMRCRAPEDDQTAVLEQAAFDAGRRGLSVLLGLYLGMRCAEIAAASWSGYDGSHFAWRRVKGGDEARLPVHPRLAVALDSTERWGPYLFPSARRPHVAPGTIWSWVKRIGDECGVEVSTHQLRHASINRVVEAEGIRVGQEWAGHRSPEITAGYSRVAENQMTQAMGALRWGGDAA